MSSTNKLLLFTTEKLVIEAHLHRFYKSSIFSISIRTTLNLLIIHVVLSYVKRHTKIHFYNLKKWYFHAVYCKYNT